MKPITPEEAITEVDNRPIPDQVIAAFNELIVRNMRGRISVVKQDDVVELIVSKGLKRDDIFNNHWLDIEKRYEAAGWKVVYDKPAYCENYPSTFSFTRLIK